MYRDIAGTDERVRAIPSVRDRRVRATKVRLDLHLYNEGNTVTRDLLRQGAQWLSGRVLDLRPRGRRCKPYQRHCVVSLSKTH